jgi:2-polyprenyl-3-methyl-5-hydroxy-6-metoxy-1,4-benzoquinol methylase
MPLIHRPCPVCDAADRRLLFQVEDWAVSQCACCGMVYLPETPDYQEHVEHFTWERSFAHEQQRRQQKPFYRFHRLLRFRKAPPPVGYLRWVMRQVRQGTLLDIGCGGGEFLAQAGQFFHVHGVEISPALAHAAQERVPAATIYQVPGAELPVAAGTFDVITMFCYLEHEVHPRQVLEVARDMLVPGGRLFIKVPNYASLNRRVRGRDWCGYRFPDHCNYFTPQTLGLLITRSGLRLLPARFRDCLPTSDNMYVAAQKVI